ncbi:LysR family transcriptional regulator [Sphingobium sp. WTD-1]|uniref:LysR family transcriptional regulator n=2 Tax=Pseudomonadota TaxID=1224 RepID=UPI001F37E538|nr:MULTISPECIES: LysR family transcriptional regulator [Pseudomonadota]MCE4545042.1 LysR family transcriptional regulator [Caballeronia sp. PC1]WIA57765.1 LysR family transcriptional regulator [Sphingobium sp. WTD-1]
MLVRLFRQYGSMAPSFKQLDLNLLRVFAAVMEERSALRASRLLCTSQSAVSHALARLRDQLGDDLFLRTRRGLKPTARALELAPEIVAALAIVRTAVERQEFDPATSDRTFTLAASDALSILTVQNLLREFGRSAPGVSLVVKPGTRVDLGEMIDLGRIDVALGSFSEWPEHMRFDPMAAYRDVLISPIGSTPIERSDQLHSRRLAVVSVGGEEEGAIGGFIYERGLGRRTEMYDKAALERAFRNCGLIPRPLLAIPHALLLPELVVEANLTAIIPHPLGAHFCRTHPVRLDKLPYPCASQQIGMIWHQRSDKDEGLIWFRSILRSLVSRLVSDGDQLGGAKS